MSSHYYGQTHIHNTYVVGVMSGMSGLISVLFPCYIFLILGQSTLYLLSPAQSFNVILGTYVTESSISIVMSASPYLQDSQNLYLVDSRYCVLVLS